jgi:hypothetical protein
MKRKLLTIVIKGTFLMFLGCSTYLLSSCEKNKKGICHQDCTYASDEFSSTRQECDDFADIHESWDPSTQTGCEVWFEEED